MSVLVYTENWDGKFKKLSFELVSYASSLADLLKTTVTAVSIGKADEDELKKLGDFGAVKILNITCPQLTYLDNQVYAKIIAETAHKENSEIIIFANNNTGKALAPRVSVRLKAGLASGVNRLPSGIEPFVISKRSYSGNAYAHIIINTSIKVITLSQNSFDLITRPTGALPITVEAIIDGSVVKTKVTETHRQTGKIVLTDADIVVSGGRGMKSPDNWGPLVELADLLGGATAVHALFRMKDGDPTRNTPARQVRSLHPIFILRLASLAQPSILRESAPPSILWQLILIRMHLSSKPHSME
jgi:electron transfer flavoprotein alpha subunit